MDFDLTDTERALREDAAEFSAREVAPRAADADQRGALDPALIAALGRAGFPGLLVDTKYGGRGASMRGFTVALEEIARGCASTGALVALQNAVVAAAVQRGGRETEKRDILPRLASGALLGAYAYAEP